MMRSASFIKKFHYYSVGNVRNFILNKKTLEYKNIKNFSSNKNKDEFFEELKHSCITFGNKTSYVGAGLGFIVSLLIFHDQKDPSKYIVLDLYGTIFITFYGRGLGYIYGFFWPITIPYTLIKLIQLSIYIKKN
jgi:hypothetical protein